MHKESNIVSLFIDRNINRGLGDHTAIYFQDEEITYSGLSLKINRTGNAFKNRGVIPHDRVCLILDDTPDFVVCFLALLKIGAIPVLINTFLKPGDFKYIIRNCLAKTVVIDKNKVDNTADLINSPGIPQWIVSESLQEAIEPSSDELETAGVNDNSIAFFLYTSGTTGKPKGVAHLHKNMLFCYNSYGKSVFNINTSDRTFSASKLFFAYGLQHNLALPFSAGAGAILLPGKPTPSSMLKILRKYHPSLFFAVPAIYRTILNYTMEKPDQKAIEKVRLWISAGEPLPAEVLGSWKQKYNKEIIDGIGCTESLSDFFINMPGKVIKGSCGYLIKGYREKIVDKKGHGVSEGTTGNLKIKSDCIAPFYLDKNGKLTKTTVNGWFTTGDRFSKHKDGYYIYHGRSDDMMKVEGLWVSPIEVERALMSHPAVLECAVVSALMEDGFIKPKAFIVLKDRGEYGEEDVVKELKKFLKNKISSYKIPVVMVCVPSLPKTATGKILRYKLRDNEKNNT